MGTARQSGFQVNSGPKKDYFINRIEDVYVIYPTDGSMGPVKKHC